MMQRRFVLVSGAAGTLAAALPLRAQAQSNLALALNRAARMRALSQRTTKAYAQWQLAVLPDAAQTVLGRARALIQSGQADLSKVALSDAASRHFSALNAHSAALLAVAAAAPSKDSVQVANGHAERMLQSAEELTRALEGGTAQSSARFIGVAGRQRMLSQRIAKNYFLSAVGVDSDAQRAQMAQDRKDFSAAIKTLGESPISTAAIRADLAAISGQWVFVEPVLDRKPEADGLRVVATTSERLLEATNDLTNKYEQALRDVLG